MTIDSEADSEMLITLTSDIVAAHVSHNRVAVDDVASLIAGVHAALSNLGTPAQEAAPEPAVSIRSSVKKDHLVCLEDGKKMKMLKRHLMTEHAMTPDEYRQRWGLSADYPMVAPDYAETRRDLAKKIGLGRKPGAKVTRASAAPKAAAAKKPATQKAPAKRTSAKRASSANATSKDNGNKPAATRREAAPKSEAAPS